MSHEITVLTTFVVICVVYLGSFFVYGKMIKTESI